MSGHDFPRWLIDDTSGIGDARVFVTHLREPRFVGELLPDDEADPHGITLAAPLGQTLCHIIWFDEPRFDVNELCESLAAALRHHDAVRGLE